MPSARKAPAPAAGALPAAGERGDFTTDRRVLPLAGMAAVIGAFSAFVALALVRLIDLFTNAFYYHRLAAVPASPAGNHLGLLAVLVPVAGGLIIGAMARFGSEKIRGHGIPEALEAILIGRSRMDLKVAVLKPLSSALSIGTGGPFGAEGPIIMTGGAFGSLFAQAFHLTPAERKTLLVAGAAGGMTGIFATPLAATLLAVELLLFEWKPRSFIPVACASAVAMVVRVPLLGTGPTFPIAPHAALAWSGMAGAAALGLIAGLGSSVLTLMVYGCEDLFGLLPIHWMWWPLLGGLAVGLGGLVEPRALGVGYPVIQNLLAGRFALAALISLLVVKAAIWSVSLGSGTSGGVLAPLLMMGGALGAACAGFLPGHDAGLWALIGMGAMMGGTMRSPFTAIVFLVELTRDIAMVPPLLAACVAADAVTVLLMKRSILTEKVARRGHHVMREYVVNPLQLLRVEDVMEPQLLPEAAPGGDGRVVTHPDELLAEAANKMFAGGHERLAVVSREVPARTVGYLDLAGMLEAWLHQAREEREPGWLAIHGGPLLGRLRDFFARKA